VCQWAWLSSVLTSIFHAVRESIREELVCHRPPFSTIRTRTRRRYSNKRLFCVKLADRKGYRSPMFPHYAFSILTEILFAVSEILDRQSSLTSGLAITPNSMNLRACRQ